MKLTFRFSTRPVSASIILDMAVDGGCSRVQVNHALGEFQPAAFHLGVSVIYALIRTSAAERENRQGEKSY